MAHTRVQEVVISPTPLPSPSPQSGLVTSIPFNKHVLNTYLSNTKNLSYLQGRTPALALGNWKETGSIMLKGKLRNREGWFKLSHRSCESRAPSRAPWSLLPPQQL